MRTVDYSQGPAEGVNCLLLPAYCLMHAACSLYILVFACKPCLSANHRDLLRESPAPALRACSALAQAYAPLAHELFHAAFVSCWWVG